ncbi:hypothetical protein AURDEDRAFT_114632 [Auricularia subglabra TFB-10046 SS5]|nr:hypothetical protein AURDEDRAFT_114632 [Auricularia subglabra TFB-10046 SS5]
MRARHVLWSLAATPLLFLVSASTSSPRPRSVRDESARQHARRAQAWTADALPKMATGSGFTALDHDGDGYLSFQELLGGQKMIWSSADNADRAHTAFNLPILTPESFAHLDLDHDGRLSPSELAEHVAHMQLPADQDNCNAMAEKLDMCSTSATLRCSSYLATADSLCRTGHYNLVETCIAASACGDICSCIEKVELAAHGLQGIVLQDDSLQALAPLGSSTNATSLQLYKRQIPILGIIIALVLAIIGITAEQLALLSEEIIVASVAGARSMDFKVWADGANPPACSVYLFWSHSCGAILSHNARTCSNGGTRVFGNSCRDHFRYGSAGCGFLSLGCKSLCYGVNQQGCPCSMFRWNEQDDVDYPGNDISSMHADVTSDCRNACEQNPECNVFETLPWDGTKTQVNCLLKSTSGTPKKSKGVTSFIKLGGTEATCATDIQGGWGLFDRRRGVGFGWNDELFGPRTNATTAVDKAQPLGIRASQDPPAGPWPFDPRDITFLVIATFLRAFYGTGDGWVNRDVVANTYGYTITPIGQNRLLPDANEPVADLTNPRWRIAESWRVLDVYRAVLNAASASGAATPVQAFLNAQGTTGLDAALFPTSLRNLLIANEQAIQRAGQAWVGRNTPPNMNGVPPHPNIQVAHAGGSGIRYYQGGGVGPFSIEGAFLVAAQAAGIDFNRIRQLAAANPRAAYWVGAITPPRPRQQNNAGSCMTANAGTSRNPRALGYAFRPTSTSAQGDGRAGFYIALEVDFDLTNDDRNIFVFAVHVIDPHSRLQVTNPNNLQALQYTTYTPPTSRATTPSPGAAGAPPAGPSNGAQTRIFAHGHATFIRYSDLQRFLTQGNTGGVNFPAYTPIGFLHIYILSENDNEIWPRFGYLRGDDQN